MQVSQPLLPTLGPPDNLHRVPSCPIGAGHAPAAHRDRSTDQAVPSGPVPGGSRNEASDQGFLPTQPPNLLPLHQDRAKPEDVQLLSPGAPRWAACPHPVLVTASSGVQILLFIKVY